MLCIAGDFNAHVGIVEPGEEESVAIYGLGARNPSRKENIILRTSVHHEKSGMSGMGQNVLKV